jgi:GntR family transcriptional regulator
VPIYLQIINQIETKIVDGQLKAGDQLPTVRQLATELRVNFNTVARAYRSLDEAGLISTQHGRGTYVWEHPSPESAEKLRLEGLDTLARRFVVSAARLGYSPEEVTAAVQKEIALWEAGKLPEASPSEL